MRFTVLGPVAVDGPAGPVPIGPLRHRKLLAMLLLDRGRPVPIRRLIDSVCEDQPVATAWLQVYSSTSALRRRLVAAGGDRTVITSAAGAVRCDPAGGGTDLADLDALERAARAAVRPDRAAEALRAAVNLWTGPSLAGLTGSFFRFVAERLDERRLAALQQCVDLELRLHPPQRLVVELDAVVTEHPFREAFVGQLMQALYLAGRPADALAVFRRTDARLRRELGIGPGAELVRLHTAMLRRELDPSAGRPWLPARARDHLVASGHP